MRQCQLEGCDYTFVVGLATQDSVLKNLELHLKFHELLELHLRFHELTTDQTESAVEEGHELWRKSRPHKETNSGGRVDLTSRQTIDQDTKDMVVKNLKTSPAGPERVEMPGRVEIDSGDETDCGGRPDITSRQTVEGEQTSPQSKLWRESKPHVNTNCGGRTDLTSTMGLLTGEMQEKISEKSTKPPKHEGCGHGNLWLFPEDVWMIANGVRRQTNFCGGSPARSFVMAHQRARCHRNQESTRIGLAGGRGTQDIQSPGQSRQQHDYEGLHSDWRLPCDKHGTKGQTNEIAFEMLKIEEMGETESETGSLRSSVSTEVASIEENLEIKNRERGTYNLISFLSKHLETFDVPENITSDIGPDFASSKVQNFVKSLNIKRRLFFECDLSASTVEKLGIDSIERTLRGYVTKSKFLNYDGFSRASTRYRNTPRKDMGTSPSNFLIERDLDEQLQAPTGDGEPRRIQEICAFGGEKTLGVLGVTQKGPKIIPGCMRFLTPRAPPEIVEDLIE